MVIVIIVVLFFCKGTFLASFMEILTRFKFDTLMSTGRDYFFREEKKTLYNY